MSHAMRSSVCRTLSVFIVLLITLTLRFGFGKNDRSKNKTKKHETVDEVVLTAEESPAVKVTGNIPRERKGKQAVRMGRRQAKEP